MRHEQQRFVPVIAGPENSAPDPGDDVVVAMVESLVARLEKAHAAIAQSFIGQRQVVDLAVATLLCGGHGLVVGLPGLGKTLLVETLGRVLGLRGGRVQFTPDLMPADILGSEVLDTDPDGKRTFRFIEGPVFCQLLMADEVNRASPRTQSALLQAMQEQRVTVAGRSLPLELPFHVFATQNPIEQEGTYPLPEAQLDRFLMQIDVNYPDRGVEADIIMATTGANQGESLQVMNASELLEAQRMVRRMPAGEQVLGKVLDVVRSLRPGDPSASEYVNSRVSWGPGPRAAQALMLAVRARALLDGRFAPAVDDVTAMALPVLRHRMALGMVARAQGDSLEDLIVRTAAAHDPAGTMAA